VSLEVPGLNDTLAVLRTARSAKDKR
jgi:hypothetical protein